VRTVQSAAVQNFMEDHQQYGPPLRYRYHTYLSERSLPAVVRVNVFPSATPSRRCAQDMLLSSTCRVSACIVLTHHGWCHPILACVVHML
jgi:hypothetical protein